MTFERISEIASDLTGWVVTSIAAGGVWIIRRVLTNQKQIEMLQAEIKHRDQIRVQDREDLQDIKTDVKELRNDIKSLFQKG